MVEGAQVKAGDPLCVLSAMKVRPDPLPCNDSIADLDRPNRWNPSSLPPYPARSSEFSSSRPTRLPREIWLSKLATRASRWNGVSLTVAHGRPFELY